MSASITEGKASIAVGTIRRRREINWRLKDIPRRILLRNNKDPFFRIFIDVKIDIMIVAYDETTQGRMRRKATQQEDWILSSWMMSLLNWIARPIMIPDVRTVAPWKMIRP